MNTHFLFLFGLYCSIFILCSFLGWIADDLYRRTVAGKDAPRIIPFIAPPYGFAALALVLIYFYIPVNPFFQVVLGTLAAIAIEFLSGVFCLKVYKRRLWDYSRSRFNLYGHVDLMHSCYWFASVFLVRWIVMLITGT